VRCPIDGPRLLFHKPPAAITATAIQVMMEARTVRVSGTHEATLVIDAFGNVTQAAITGQEAQWIVIPGSNIQIPGHCVMIEFDKIAHEIMYKIPSRTQFPDNLGLQAVEANHLIGTESPVSQAMSRVAFGYVAHGQADLFEAIVFHAPENVAPGLVQRVDFLVALFAPENKRGQRVVRIAQGSAVATVLVVSLPGELFAHIHLGRKAMKNSSGALSQIHAFDHAHQRRAYLDAVRATIVAESP